MVNSSTSPDRVRMATMFGYDVASYGTKVKSDPSPTS